MFSFNADDLQNRLKIVLADNPQNAIDFYLTCLSINELCLRKLCALFNDELSSKVDR